MKRIESFVMADLKTISVMVFFFMAPLLFADPLVLAEAGKTSYTIVTASSLSAIDRLAADELKHFLNQVTGADFKIVDDSAVPTSNKIFLGMGNGAKINLNPKKENLYDKLLDQESVIQCRGNNLFLYGKGKYGNLWAVYEFLESRIGCRFLDVHGFAFVPFHHKLEVNRTLHTAHYAFEVRSLMSYIYPDTEPAAKFLYRNRQNFDLKTKVSGLENVYELCMPHHAIPILIPPFTYENRLVKFMHPPLWLRDKAYFKTNPDFFSMDEHGQRVPDRHLCYSNLELQKELTKNIIRYYSEEKKKPEYAGQKLVMEISSYDKAYNLCYCPSCSKLQREYQSPGAPMILYMAELAHQYPDILFMTAAYQRGLTQIPPSLEQPLPSNLLICFAPINANFSHAWNETTLNYLSLDDLRRWRQLTNRILCWYYPNTYIRDGKFIAPPCACLDRIATDIRILHDLGVEGTFFEQDSGGITEFTNFTALQNYVMLKLFQRPYLDLDKLIHEFISLYYGDAAKQVKKYYYSLAEKHQEFIDNGGTWVHWMNNYYLTLDKMKEWSVLFDEAESAAQGEFAFHVCLLRLGLDSAIIEALRLDFDRVLFDECRRRMERTILKLEGRHKLRQRKRNPLSVAFAEWITSVESSQKVSPMPPELSSLPAKNVAIIAPKFKSYKASQRRADDLANFGMALWTHLDDKDSFSAVIRDGTGKPAAAELHIPAVEIAKDRYAIYKFEPLRLTPDSTIVLQNSLEIPIGELTNYDDPQSLTILWYVYLSLRYDSRFRNIYCDRVYLVLSDTIKNQK